MSMSRRTVLRLLGVSTFAFAIGSSSLLHAEYHDKKVARVDQYNLGKDKVAVKGYDPVSYHGGKPLKGEAKFKLAYRGVVYHFASEENRRKFEESPEKYKPTYGGWCAKAIAYGDKVDIDPKNYKITDGRLFLFYKGVWGDALKDWNKDERNLIVKADEKWKGIAGE